METAREADEIKRFQTGGNAIKGDGENRHFCTKEHLIWSVCVRLYLCVHIFTFFFCATQIRILDVASQQTAWILVLLPF